MAQIFDPLPLDQSIHLLCCYMNATSKIQIARIANISNWYFERVVFPGQRLAFEAPPQAVLEIHTGMMASAILSDKIACERLCISEEDRGTVPKDQEATNQKQMVPGFEQKNHSVLANLPVAALTTLD